jgi:hypothetical protein
MKGFLVRLSRIFFVIGVIVIGSIAYFSLPDGEIGFLIGSLTTFLLIISGLNYLFLGQAQPWAEEEQEDKGE